MFAARRVAARVASTTVAPTTAVGAQVRSVSGSSSAAASLYRLVFKRNATYVAFVIGGAMVGGCVYDKFMDSVFVAYNQGVRVVSFRIVRVSSDVGLLAPGLLTAVFFVPPPHPPCYLHSVCMRPSTGASGRAHVRTMTTMMMMMMTRTRTRMKTTSKCSQNNELGTKHCLHGCLTTSTSWVQHVLRPGGGCMLALRCTNVVCVVEIE